MDSYFDLLLTCPLFAGMDRTELAAILPCLGGRITEVFRGDPVFLEGDPAGFIGVVLAGGVQIVREDYYGSRSILTHAEPGDLFGEVFACAALHKMPVSGYAAKDSRLLLMDCRKMVTVCPTACPFHSRLIQNLLQAMAQKNLFLSRKIHFMSRKTTREKLLAYLLDQAKRQGRPDFTIPFDRQALADFLGVERSAMSAELGKLRREGVLESKGAHFRLLMPPEG